MQSSKTVVVIQPQASTQVFHRAEGHVEVFNAAAIPWDMPAQPAPQLPSMEPAAIPEPVLMTKP